MKSNNMNTTIYLAGPMMQHYLEIARGDKENPEECKRVIICSPEGTISEEDEKKYSDEIEKILKMHEANPPKQMAYISGVDVYGRTDGTMHDEQTPTWASTREGKLRARTEKRVLDWCKAHKAVCTILRPAQIMGKHMDGWPVSMNAGLCRGVYYLIRDAEACKSVVTAYDVARAAYALLPHGGVYNLTDYHRHPLRTLAEGMLDNQGRGKRPFTLPLKWAKIVASMIDVLPEKIKAHLPGLQPLLSTDELKFRTQELTFSAQRFAALDLLTPFDVVQVLCGQAEGYPYEDF